MTNIILEIGAGLLAMAAGWYCFWWIGQEHNLTPRQRNSAFAASLAVLVVLGTWAGGAGLLVHSAVQTYQAVAGQAKR
jgi:hypothetical protein